MAIVKPTLDFSCSGNGSIVIYSPHHGVFIGLFVLSFAGFQRKTSCLSVEGEKKEGKRTALLINQRKQVCLRKEKETSSSRFLFGIPSLMLLPGYWTSQLAVTPLQLVMQSDDFCEQHHKAQKSTPSWSQQEHCMRNECLNYSLNAFLMHFG